ncbi:MAG: AAA family ATPase [Snowella sp.]|nr:AAA family ATPase [Snowella sp.]
MKVKRLELKGFRGFDEIVLDFDTTSKRPTVFIGNNGVGKSSILDSLAILLSYFVSELHRDPKSSKQGRFAEIGKTLDRHDTNNSYKESGKQADLTISIQAKNEKNYQWNALNPIGKSAVGNQVEKLVNNIIDTQHESIQDIPIILYYSVNRFIPEIYLENTLNNNEFQNPLDAYENSLAYYNLRSIDEIGALMRINQMPSSMPTLSYRGARPKSDLEKKTITFDAFFEWFKYIEDLENERIRDDANYQDKKLVAVREAVYSLIPDFSDLRIRRSPLQMTVNKIIGDKVEELSIDQLSDGEKCLLAMVGDIARRLAIANPSLDDPLQGEGIVLIDEIELHLHPQWQHKIIPRLTETFPNCQFIVTTHSPQVLSHVQPENIYILQSTPNGIIASHPESSYGRDSNQILEDYMGTPERPQDIKDKILEIFQVIDQNDLGQAKKLCESLGSEIGSDEPELIRARAVIKRKEILGK